MSQRNSAALSCSSSGAEEYVPHRGHSNRDRDQADCEDQQNRGSPFSLSGLCRRLDYNPVLFRHHGETLNSFGAPSPRASDSSLVFGLVAWRRIGRLSKMRLPSRQAPQDGSSRKEFAAGNE